MSVNNLLLISKSNFIIKECDADSGYCSPIAEGRNLEEAIELAEKYAHEKEIEYGIHFEE